MADRIHSHPAKPPARRVTDRRGYFFPGEVARLLRLDGIDYAQLRRLLKLVRADDPPPRGAWGRYSLQDLANLKAAVDLAGGVEALQPGRRLRIVPLQQAFVALKAAGFPHPLIDVSLSRLGSRLVARGDGVTFEASNGQLLLDLAHEDATAYLGGELLNAEFAVVNQAMNAERRALRPRHWRAKMDCRVEVSTAAVP
jgi:hypothetical protein